MIEINMFGFTAHLGFIQFEDGKRQYCVNFETRPIALDTKSLRQYIMFLEYVEYYLEELNA
jgi:hypothetical protein